MLRENVKVRKLRAEAIIPTYGSEYAAGADLYSCLEKEAELAPGETVLISTGIAMEIPEGYVGLIYARSGMATKQGLAPANKVGVIDADYRGEIKVPLHNHSREIRMVAPGERIAQFVLTPYLAARFEEAETLSDTVRGEAGFGSTGKQ